MLKEQFKYSLNDVFIEPTATSFIDDINKCNPYYSNGMLPVFAAPSVNIVDENNYDFFNSKGVNTIIPKEVSFKKRMKLCAHGKTWVEFSICEFESAFIHNESSVDTTIKYVLIQNDFINMAIISNMIAIAKKMHGTTLQIMVNNVISPLTFKELALRGVDYVILGMSESSLIKELCIGYPMASLISECAKLKNENYLKTKIIVKDDMYFYNYVKALALGADYIMNDNFGLILENVSPTLEVWVNNFCSQLKQVMLLTNSMLLDDFKNGCNVWLQTKQ